MKITELIERLQELLSEHGDLEVTMTETNWIYLSVKSASFKEDVYYKSDEDVIVLED